VRERAAYVLAPKFSVKPYGGIDILHDSRWAGGEASAPLLVRRRVSSVWCIVQRKDSGMALTTRRAVLAAATTLVASLAPRKPMARELPDLTEVLIPVDPPRTPPDGVFLDADGGEHTIASLAGHGMVINFWATWCQPCIAEMPSLVALAQALAPHDIAVLPLSSDRGGAKIVSAWFEQHGITGLPILLDPKGALSQAWGGKGIPTTHVIARDGKERARLEGAADWSTPASIALIQALVETSAG
jgi:thiol-disulfide isomerase/thioredoxin